MYTHEACTYIWWYIYIYIYVWWYLLGVAPHVSHVNSCLSLFRLDRAVLQQGMEGSEDEEDAALEALAAGDFRGFKLRYSELSANRLGSFTD